MNTDEKIRHVIEVSLAGLPPEALAARVAWCRETGQHGVSARVDGDAVVFTWAGVPLAVVERAALVDDDAELPAGEYLRAAVPDTVPEDWQ